MKERIWLSSPHMGGGEIKYVNEAFDTNWISPLGPNVNGFEDSIVSFLDHDVHVAALASGTASLHVALILLNIGLGDDVICQSLTFSASANPIIYVGANPVFVDSETQTWNMCPEALEEAIVRGIENGRKPKAIIAVSIYGMPYQAEAIREIADHYNIPIIEDSAEALGSTYDNQKCGTLGDISILSFNGNKIITSSGGGALVVKTEDLKKRAIFLSTQSKDDAPYYQHSELGYNYRLSNVSAGIGRGQMEVLTDRVNQRRANHQFYKDIFKDKEGITIHEEPDARYFSNFWLSAILIDPKKTNGLTTESMRLALLEDNIETRPLWKPLHLQPYFASCKYYGQTVAEDLFNIGLCLPSGSNMTQQQRDLIEEKINQLFI